MQWADFYEYLRENWKAGEHVALVGRTGSGKTVLERTILPLRRFVVVAATKVEDSSLYKPLQASGFKLSPTFDAEDLSTPKVIFKPPLKDSGEIGKDAQRYAFANMLEDIFATGAWCAVFDEVRYLTEDLRPRRRGDPNLEAQLNTLWLQGRSLGVTIVAATQRPVSVPLNMFEQATHILAFRLGRADDRKRVAEYAGDNGPLVEYLIPRLPRFEALYINPVTDELIRTRVS